MRKKFILHPDNIVQFCSGDHRESLPSSSYQSDPSHWVESSGSTEIIICLLTWTLSTTYIFFNLFISRIVDPPIWTVFGIETMFCTADKVLVLLHQLQDTLIAWLVIELEIASDNFTDSLYRPQFPLSSKFIFKKGQNDFINEKGEKWDIPKLGEMSQWLDSTLWQLSKLCIEWEGNINTEYQPFMNISNWYNQYILNWKKIMKVFLW